MELTINQATSYLNDDELQVGREDIVYDAALRWIRHDESRKQYMKDILGEQGLILIQQIILLENK